MTHPILIMPGQIKNVKIKSTNKSRRIHKNFTRKKMYLLPSHIYKTPVYGEKERQKIAKNIVLRVIRSSNYMTESDIQALKTELFKS